MGDTRPTASVQAFLEANLEHLLGPLMAGAAIKSQCAKLQLSGPQLGRAEIERLVEALAKGTRVFAGARRTEEVFEDLAERVMEATHGG